MNITLDVFLSRVRGWHKTGGQTERQTDRQTVYSTLSVCPFCYLLERGSFSVSYCSIVCMCVLMWNFVSYFVCVVLCIFVFLCDILLPSGVIINDNNVLLISLSLSTFLPRDAMHNRGYCRHAVSVRLSVPFMDHVKTNKHIFGFFSPSGSHT